jgi:hypothetical protein
MGVGGARQPPPARDATIPAVQVVATARGLLRSLFMRFDMEPGERAPSVGGGELARAMSAVLGGARVVGWARAPAHHPSLTLAPTTRPMTQRQLAPLCLVLVLACTPAAPPAPATIAAPSAAPVPPPVEPPAELAVEPPALAPIRTREGEIDAEALLRRDGVLQEREEGGSDEGPVRSVVWAELDGEAPLELIIHTREALDEGTWTEHLWVYDLRDPNDPKLLDVPRIDVEAEMGLYERDGFEWEHRDDSGGWWRVEDLDGDGWAEVIIVEQSRFEENAVLHVAGWGQRQWGAGLMIRLWIDPEVSEAVVVDVDGDGRREIVGVRGGVADGVHGPGLVVLRVDERGLWSPVPGAIKKAWLLAVWDAIIADRGVQLALSVVPVGALMLRQKLVPRDLPALQAALLARRETLDLQLKDELPALYEAMAWRGNLAAYDTLLPIITSASGPRAVIVALLELDEQNKLKRGRVALVAWLKDALSGEVDAQLEVVGWLLRWMNVYGVREGAALVAEALGEEARGMAAREELLRVTYRFMPTQQRALLALSPTLRALFLKELLHDMRFDMEPGERAKWSAPAIRAAEAASLREP